MKKCFGVVSFTHQYQQFMKWLFLSKINNPFNTKASYEIYFIFFIFQIFQIFRLKIIQIMDAIASNIETRLDSLIGEIESSDSPIGPVLRYNLIILLYCLSDQSCRSLDLYRSLIYHNGRKILCSKKKTDFQITRIKIFW